MSTRSGKRIHGSIRENSVGDGPEIKSERKTRGKRLKENSDEVSTEKKRKHYVRYPSEEDIAVASKNEKLLRSTRKSHRNTLKEQNAATDSETSNDDRKIRRIRRAGKIDDCAENIEPSNEVRFKGNKRKTKLLSSDEITVPEVQTNKKKSNKKKCKRKSGSLIVEDIIPTNVQHNTSAMSVDSFHSAAGSPSKDVGNICDNHVVHGVPFKDVRDVKDHAQVVNDNYCMQDMPSKSTRSKTHQNIAPEGNGSNTTKKKETKRKRKLTNAEQLNISLTKNTSDEIPITHSNITQDKQLLGALNKSPGLNDSLKKSKKKRSKNASNDVNENFVLVVTEIVNHNKTPDKLQIFALNNENSGKKNSTCDKINETVTNLNAAFDKKISNELETQSESLKAVSASKNIQSRKKRHFDKINDSDDNSNVSSDKEVFENELIKAEISENALNDVCVKKKQNSTYDKIDDSETNFNATFDKEVSENELNKTEISQDTLTNANVTNSNRKKQSSTYDKINDSEANLSAAVAENVLNKTEKSLEVLTSVRNTNRKKRKSTFDKAGVSETYLNATFDNSIPDNVTNKSEQTNNKKNRKSTRKSISNKIDDTSVINLDATYERHEFNLTDKNFMQEKEKRKSRCFSKYSLDQDVSANLNITYDKDATTESQTISQNNTKFDKSPKINTTFEMAKKDSTFDKSQNDTRRGSSLISTDTTDNAASSNVTSDNSKDVSRISITSDESMAENIANTTPVLIESSMDDSHINISSKDVTTPKEINTKDVTPPLKDKLKEKGTSAEKSLKTPKFQDKNSSKTPLRLEQTYTPPKSVDTFTETRVTTTPKGKETFIIENKGSNTPKREGTYTELETSQTPLKREGTYTELNPMKTPSKKKEMSAENGHITPAKVNEVVENVPTPLKREGTFTKEDSIILASPTLNVNKTPLRRKSLPSPGQTPFVIANNTSKSSPKQEKKSMLNVTRSIEKSRRSSVDLPRATRVMFCSPVDTPAVVAPIKGRVIKSNLKGSDKSFVFDDSATERAVPGRKRSYTQSEAEAVSVKRKRLTEAAGRLPRPRTTSASGKLQDPDTPSKRASTSAAGSSKTKPEGKVLRTKLPNFAALHQKQFAKMESLDECQERKAKRARQLLTPTAPINVLDRVSPKETQETQPEQQSEHPQPKKTETPKKSILPEGYTKFGFKLNLDVNPFSVPAKTENRPDTRAKARDSRVKTAETIAQAVPTRVLLKRQTTLPSLAGATVIRKEVARQTIMREKSFSERRDVERKENRTVIKGVRTNRRFELQMQMRNLK